MSAALHLFDFPPDVSHYTHQFLHTTDLSRLLAVSKRSAALANHPHSIRHLVVYTSWSRQILQSWNVSPRLLDFPDHRCAPH